MSHWDDGEKTIIALIPAREGSVRIPGKNTRMLAGHPLIAYTIAAAKESGIFRDIIVATDSAEEIAEVAISYGATVLMRAHADALQPDIAWIMEIWPKLQAQDMASDAFAILRPTSPCRSAETIKQAWWCFRHAEGVHSLRAIRPVTEHPGKMWTIGYDGRLSPVLPYTGASLVMGDGKIPIQMHSSPTQALPHVYLQAGALEMAWWHDVILSKSISGSVVLGYEMPPTESVDLNEETEWQYLEWLITTKRVTLPRVS